MVRPLILGLVAAFAASTALAAPLKLPRDDTAKARQVLDDGFAPFDDAAQQGWEAVSPEPIYLSAGPDKPASAPLTLQPGSYRVVVLCDCNAMEVTLLKPDDSTMTAERADDRRAMYSFDVSLAGAYLAGVDMDDCSRPRCEVGVRVYRKKAD